MCGWDILDLEIYNMFCFFGQQGYSGAPAVGIMDRLNGKEEDKYKHNFGVSQTNIKERGMKNMKKWLSVF